MHQQKKYEILNSLPSYGPMYIPISEHGHQFYYEGYVLKFFKDDGTEWVANFDKGPGLNKVVEYAKENLIVVFAGGIAYVMNPNNEKPIKIIGSSFYYVFQNNNKELVCLDNTGIQIFDPRTSEIWTSERISWDGFKDVVFEQGIIKGKSYDAINSKHDWCDFSFDLNGYKIEGGSFRANSSRELDAQKKTWWRFWK